MVLILTMPAGGLYDEHLAWHPLCDPQDQEFGYQNTQLKPVTGTTGLHDSTTCN